MPFHAVRILSSLPGGIAFAARREQLCARAREQRVGFVARDRETFDDRVPRVAAMQVPLAFEVRRFVETVQRFDDEVFVFRQQPFDFVAAPDVELAFFAFGIGVDAR